MYTTDSVSMCSFAHVITAHLVCITLYTKHSMHYGCASTGTISTTTACLVLDRTLIHNSATCNYIMIRNRYDEGMADMLAGGYNGKFNNLNNTSCACGTVYPTFVWLYSI
jgi:hypothetical protein